MDPESRGHDFPAEYDIVCRVEFFTGGRIGAVGITPPHVVAWRVLLMQERADEFFKSLVGTATLAGQLYGLAGLYFTNRFALAALSEPFQAHGATVQTIFDCRAGVTPVSQVVNEILSGVLPKQLFAASQKARIMHDLDLVAGIDREEMRRAFDRLLMDGAQTCSDRAVARQARAKKPWWRFW